MNPTDQMCYEMCYDWFVEHEDMTNEEMLNWIKLCRECRREVFSEITG
jgi:hypothetical protein